MGANRTSGLGMITVLSLLNAEALELSLCDLAGSHALTSVIHLPLKCAACGSRTFSIAIEYAGAYNGCNTAGIKIGHHQKRAATHKTLAPAF
jgi:hypothetical protein